MWIIICVLVFIVLLVLNFVAGIIISNIKPKSNYVNMIDLKPGQTLRKIDKLAIEMFGGDIPETISYIMRTFKDKELEEYVLEMDDFEIRLARNVLYEMAVEKDGKKGVTRQIELRCILEELKMSEQEIKNSNKNPYSAALKKHLIIILAAVVLIGVLLGIVSQFVENHTFTYFLSTAGVVIVALNASNLTNFITKYFKFNKAKKILTESEQNK